jgi:hypothetical protein
LMGLILKWKQYTSTKRILSHMVFCSRDEKSVWNAPRQFRTQFSTRDSSVFDN